RHTRCYRDWSSDVCSSDLPVLPGVLVQPQRHGGPLLGQARPDQQPELPLQLPSPRYIAAHSNTLLGLRCCVHSLNRRRVGEGVSSTPSNEFLIRNPKTVGAETPPYNRQRGDSSAGRAPRSYRGG